MLLNILIILAIFWFKNTLYRYKKVLWGFIMISRLGSYGIEFVTKNLKTCAKSVEALTSPSSACVEDTISLISNRIKNLKLYNSSGTRNHCFNFGKNGNIKIMERSHGSEDLQFLSHIKTKTYTKPEIYPEGTLPCSSQGIVQSNKLAKEFISENDHFINGYRYCGSNAEFNSLGKNVSRFKNGTQEIVVDKTLDKVLVQTINTFKTRLKSQKLTEEEKINELMKFVDEVFSVSKAGEQTEKLVSNMCSDKQTEVLLGSVINSGAGICRHRSLLSKILADEVGLKCRIIKGYYGKGGHAWNEILTKGETYLFDSMHGNIFNITNPSKNIVPQTFRYKITNPNDTAKLISKYLEPNSTSDIIYRSMKYKTPIRTNEAILTPTVDGYLIEPLGDKIFVNGEKLSCSKKVMAGDFVNIKDIGFQIT